MGNNLSNERFKIIPSVYLLLERDGKTLLARRFNTGYEDGKYGLVSGHAEEKETFRQAMVREAREESGLLLDANHLELVHIMHRSCGDHERADIFFTISEWQGNIAIMEPNKCDEIGWFPLDQLPENTISYIRRAIDSWQKRIPYSEYGWDMNAKSEE